MNPTAPQDLADAAQLQALFAQSCRRARALAFALAHVHGLAGEAEVAGFVRAALAAELGLPAAGRARPPAPAGEDEPRGEARSAQEEVLAVLREADADLTVAQLHTVLDDAGVSITQNNLSVILTRLSQGGVIDRVGRGRYRARG
jgi:hypothetical protein